MYKKIVICIILLLLISSNSFAKQGCCSSHSGVCINVCCDGTELTPDCKDIYANPHIGFERVITGVVAKVIDGDTIIIHNNDGIAKIRLYGIDCPEIDQPFGMQATEFVSNLIKDSVIKVQIVNTDMYGRYLGLIRIKIDNAELKLNQELIKDGYAWVSTFCNANFCSEWKKLQYNTKTKRIGLWQDENPINPYVWRKMK